MGCSGSKQQQKAAAAPAEVKAPEVDYKISLERTSNEESLGLTIVSDGSAGYRIQALKDEGMVPTYNKKQEGTEEPQVTAGDIIVMVNDVFGDIDAMKKELSQMTLALGIKRQPEPAPPAPAPAEAAAPEGEQPAADAEEPAAEAPEKKEEEAAAAEPAAEAAPAEAEAAAPAAEAAAEEVKAEEPVAATEEGATAAAPAAPPAGEEDSLVPVTEDAQEIAPVENQRQPCC